MYITFKVKNKDNKAYKIEQIDKLLWDDLSPVDIPANSSNIELPTGMDDSRTLITANTKLKLKGDRTYGYIYLNFRQAHRYIDVKLTNSSDKVIHEYKIYFGKVSTLFIEDGQLR